MYKPQKFLAAAALGVLALASCQKEKILDASQGDDLVTFTVQPQLTTKAVADNDGYGAEVDEVKVAVYLKNGEDYKLYDTPEVEYTKGNLETTFSVNLIRNQTYQIVVWADKDGVYDFDESLTSVSRNEKYKNAINDDALDAFYASVEFVQGTTTDKTIPLTRPFGQLNLITTDLNSNKEFQPSEIIVSYVSSLSFNPFDGSVADIKADADTVSYKSETPYYKSDNDAEGKKLSQHTLAMNYVFAPAAGQYIIPSVTLKAKVSDYAEAQITNVPVQRNYRTNVIGALLTDPEDFIVEVDAEWATQAIVREYVSFTEVSKAVSGSDADVIISEEAGEDYVASLSEEDKEGLENYGTDDEQLLGIPLVLTAESGESKTIELPDAPEGYVWAITSTADYATKELNVTAKDATDLVIDAPNTHVVLNGEEYTSVIAKATSANTLEVTSNVTVKSLKVYQGGVKISGKVENLEIEVKGTIPAIEIAEGAEVAVGACTGLSEALFESVKDYIKEGYEYTENDGVYDIVKTVYQAKIDEKYYKNLSDALSVVQKTGGYLTVLEPGTYTVQAIEGCGGYTIDAAVEGVKFVSTQSKSYWINGEKGLITIKNLTWEIGTYDYQYIRNVEMENCTIVGMFCGHTYDKFTDCTFENPNGYIAWSYAAENLMFDGCTFNAYNGKALNVFWDSCPDAKDMYISVQNCKFYNKSHNTSNSVDVCKPALYIKNGEGSNKAIFNIEINDSVFEGFGPANDCIAASLPTDEPYVNAFGCKYTTYPVCVTVDGEVRLKIDSSTPLGYDGSLLMTPPSISGDVITVSPANAQYVLDGAWGSIDGKTIRFSAGNYSRLIFGLPTKYSGSNTKYGHLTGNSSTDKFSEDAQMSYEDFIAYKNQSTWTEVPAYVRTIENVTFTADAGAVLSGVTFHGGSHIYASSGSTIYDYVRCKEFEGSGYYQKLVAHNIVFDGISFVADASEDSPVLQIATSEAETDVDGVTVRNCSFKGHSTDSKGKQAIRFYTEQNTSVEFNQEKNLLVENSTFDTFYQGIYTHTAYGVTVSKCTISNTGHNAIAIQNNGSSYPIVSHGLVKLVDNRFENIADRVIRLGAVGSDTQFVITGNVAVNAGDTDKEVIKATSLADGITYDIHDNDWGEGRVISNDEFKDKVD